MTDIPSGEDRRFGERARRPGTPGFGPVGIVVGAVLVLALLGGLLWSALAGDATAATHPNVLGGSIVVSDGSQAPAVLDRATGEVTVQLLNVNQQVGAQLDSDVQYVPAGSGTMLVNDQTGAFNFLQADNYVADTKGSGVGLGSLAGSTQAQGYSAGNAAYIVRKGPKSTVSLVDSATVTDAASNASTTASADSAVRPVGYTPLAGEVASLAYGTATSGGKLWTLLDATAGSCSLEQIARTTKGTGLRPHAMGTVTDCAQAALTATGGTVGVASPGQVVLYPGGRIVKVPTTTAATKIIPVSGPGGVLWYLADEPTGWTVFGVKTAGTVAGSHPLAGISAKTTLATPVVSDGKIYTLARNAVGQPPLWVIDPTSGKVSNLAGVAGGTYPRFNANESDRSFAQAQLLVSGPRVVYNNPASIEAVVVFTDGSRPPLVVDKFSGVQTSATGPAAVANVQGTENGGVQGPGGGHSKHAKSGHFGKRHHGSSRSSNGKSKQKTTTPTTVPQHAPSVSTRVNCADTTEKPYVPTGVTVSPADESAQLAWSYTLLTASDCEPRTWSVKVTALGGAPQPSNPVQYVDGQDALNFTGLRPSTQYQAVVTAYISHQSTPSAPVTFKTTAQGADAPTSVSARLDQNGDWVVSWRACHSSHCYTPAAQWVVSGSACGGSYAGSPVNETVSGGSTSATLDAVTLGRLGQSLTFTVQGISAQGLRGNSTAGGGCIQSWRAPQRNQITLTSSGTVSGQSVTATLQVSPATSTVDTYGSTATDFEYLLDGRVYSGPTTSTSATIRGLSPNTRYRPAVKVWPAGHPSAAVTVGGATVKDDLSWPADISATGTFRLAGGNPNLADAIVGVNGLQGNSYTISGSLTCGSRQYSFNNARLAGGIATVAEVDLDTTPNCNSGLSFRINSTATPNPYGTSSGVIQAGLQGYPTTAPIYTFDYSYSQSGCSGGIRFDGCTTYVTVTAPDLSTGPYAGVNWQTTAIQQRQLASSGCQATSAMSAPGRVTLTMKNCPYAERPLGVPPAVEVHWEYLGLEHSGNVVNQGGTSGSTTSTTTPPTTHPSTTTTSPPTTQPNTTTTQPSGTSGDSGTSGSGDTTTTGASATARVTPTAKQAVAALAVTTRQDDSEPPGSGSGTDTLWLELLLASAIAAAAGLGLTTRSRRRRDLPQKGSA